MIRHRIAWSIALMVVASLLCGFNIAGEPNNGTSGMQSGDRLRMKYVPHADQTYVVPVQRNGAQTIVTSTLHWPQYRWLEELSATGLRLVMLVTGLIICPIASTWMTARS